MDLVHGAACRPDRGHVLSGLLTDEAAGFLAALTGAPPARPELWHEALTHGSMGEARDYQRLEFLGDRVLGLAIATELYRRFPRESEGALSARLNALVTGAICAEVARGLNLPPLVRLQASLSIICLQHSLIPKQKTRFLAKRSNARLKRHKRAPTL